MLSALPAALDEAARAGAFHSFSIVRSGERWQANLQETRGNSFYVCHGATPSEAISRCFAVPAPRGAALSRVTPLSLLDSQPLFSLTLWRSESGWTAGVQKQAGDMVRYATASSASEAVEKLLSVPACPVLGAEASA